MISRWPARVTRLVVLAAVCLALPPASAAASPERLKILAFGDSLTYGIGGSGRGYPEWLAFFTGHEVINAGSPGDTTAHGVLALPVAIRETQPDLLIICLGWNDLLQGIPAQAMERNLSAMLAHAASLQLPVLLLGLPDPVSGDPSPVFARWEGDENVWVDTTIMVQALTTAYLKSDIAHLNQEGYREVALNIAERLKSYRHDVSEPTSD